MNDDFDIFPKEDIFSFKKTGSFGRFSTIDSFPIEFFLTTLSASQLKKLTFARDIKPASIDFEQLLQRDIDEQRVKDQIEPYITSPNLTLIEAQSKTIFFPPLLVAAVPVNCKKMEEYYGDQNIENDDRFIVRVWSKLFKLKLKKEENGYEFRPTMSLNSSKISVAREPALMEINLSDGAEKGIKLVVIDGQHRLKALIDIYNNNSNCLAEMAVPICILFSPNSTNAIAREFDKNGFSTPKVPEIFRQLFVDVNKNAEQIGGHFSILLSGCNIGSLICRQFCSYILNTRGIEGLAQIEWNQKKKKLSTEITKKYYITSIGVLEKSLSETLGKSKLIFNYLVNFDEIQKDVYPEDNDDHIEYPKINWDKFSISQKKSIQKQIEKYIIPILCKLFFESALFKSADQCFREVVSTFKEKSTSDTYGQAHYLPVLEQILEYTPIGDGSTNREARQNLRVFEEKVSLRKEAETFHLLSYAIFQRAIFHTWLEILKIGNSLDIPSNIANDLFLNLLDKVAPIIGKLISSERTYCQSFIFYSNKINPVNDVRLGISYLILATLTNNKNRDDLFLKLRLDSNNIVSNRFLEKISDLSYLSLNKYFQLLKKSKTKFFKSSYAIDSSLDIDYRRELQDAENIRKLDERDFKNGLIEKSKISNKFELMIERYIQLDLEKSKIEIKEIIGFELDVFGLTYFSGIDESGENDDELED